MRRASEVIDEEAKARDERRRLDIYCDRNRLFGGLCGGQLVKTHDGAIRSFTNNVIVVARCEKCWRKYKFNAGSI